MLNNIEFNVHPKHNKPTRYNVAGEKEIANDEIVHMVSNILKIEPKMNYIDFHSSRPGHDLRYSLDGKKIREDGWKAPLSIEDSFKRTIEWMIEHKEWMI